MIPAAAAPALRLDLRPSRLLAATLIVAHVLGLAAAWISLSGWAQYAAVAGILVFLSGFLAQALLTQAVSLELREDGHASWRTRKGGWQEGRLGRNNFVSAALVVLELEFEGRGRKWVVLMGDSTPPDEFRRLRVWLRWRKPKPE